MNQEQEQIVDIVLGCSFGDEGKGKVVYDLIRRNNYDLCVRFNGSGNAGHTIYKNNQKIVVHQLPIGILFPELNCKNLISSDCLIDIRKLKEEIDYLKTFGIDISNRLMISKSCHLITQECIDYDRANNKIGTTGSGIGPTYANKMLRIGKRVEELKDEFIEMGIQIVDMRKFWFENHFNSIIAEGAQGFELDINWTNNYPYCTSSTCTLAGAINSGLQMKNIRHIYGVSKIYDTYVGTMKFEPEGDEDLKRIGEEGKEFGATTGRRRQCNYLNLDSLSESLFINQCNQLIINKVDILEIVGVYRLYHQNQLIEFNNIDEMKKYIQNTIQLPIIFSSNPHFI